MSAPTPRQQRLVEACRRAIGLAQQGIELSAAVQDTAMKSEFTVEEIAKPIERILDAMLAARKAQDSSRVAVAFPPPLAAPVVMARADIRAPESLTTCYQGRSGSCWTEE